MSCRPACNALLHSQRAHHVRESIGNQPRDTSDVSLLEATNSDAPYK